MARADCEGVSNTLGVAMAIYVYVRAARVTTFVPVLSLILLTLGVGEPVVAVISPFGGLRGAASSCSGLGGCGDPPFGGTWGAAILYLLKVCHYLYDYLVAL